MEDNKQFVKVKGIDVPLYKKEEINDVDQELVDEMYTELMQGDKVIIRDDIQFRHEVNVHIKEGNISLKGIEIELMYPSLGIVVATNGENGGDSGHGGRTFFSIIGKDSFDVISTNTIDDGDYKGVEMIVGGDCELNVLIQAFKDMAEELECLKNKYSK